MGTQPEDTGCWAAQWGYVPLWTVIPDRLWHHVGYLLGDSCGQVVPFSLFLTPQCYAWYLPLVVKGVS